MVSTNPGELVLHSLLKQFASVCQNKVESALDEHAENDLLKCLCLQDDTAFQQLLNALYTCAEHALPSLLQTITKWYDTQHSSGPLYPFRRSPIKSSSGVRSQTISAATGQQQAAGSGRDLLIRSMVVESSGNIPSDANNPGLLTPASSNGQELAPASTWLNMPSSARENMAERRDLCIDILYCQALNAVLKQLPYHPGHDEIINKILDQAFRHFEYKENLQTKPNAENINAVADAYAKVVGELSQTRFSQVKQHFSTRLEQLRAMESNSHTIHSIISLLMGLKFFRVKMHPIEEFVAYFTFLHELGQYFLEVKEKEVRHALTCLFVEILLPVAAVVRHEVNIPALKNFVDLLYLPTFELAGKKKYALALFPLVTCLLCVGTKNFFLTNWPAFMSLCLSQLKSRDLGQVSVESLFRLLWVYVVRIKCEKHADTQTKLLSIVGGLFPKGSKSVLPKNVSSTVFVKIIHFIAQEKLDFAMTEIIFDLLGVNRLQKLVFTPERMNIGLRAFLLIAHGLQQKDGEPPMPVSAYHRISSVGACSGGVRRSFHGTTLDDALCERLGIRPYLVPVRKAFEAILRLLEPQISRSMMPPKLLSTAEEGGANTEADDSAPPPPLPISSMGDRKPKVDLLKTCVNCIPRLLPYEMSRTELIELLARVSLNVDEEVRMMAQQTMVNLIIESPAYRQRTIQAFIQFIQKYVPDTAPQQLDNCLKTLHTLLVNWKIAIQRDAASVTTSPAEKAALVEAEGFSLVMLCQCRPLPRRLAVHILRESRAVLKLINRLQQQSSTEENGSSTTTVAAAAAASTTAVMDILDSMAPALIEGILPLLPIGERNELAGVQAQDFRALSERGGPVWLCGSRPLSSWNHKPVLGPAPAYIPSTSSRNPSGFCQSLLAPYLLQAPLDHTRLTDVWGNVIAAILNTSSPLSQHPALLYAWNIVFQRLSQVFTLIDPNAQAAENRASSLLRSTSKKAAPSERDQVVPLWHNYVTFAACIAPSSTGVSVTERSPPTYDSTSVVSTQLLRRRSSTNQASSTTAQPRHLANSKLFIAAREKARDLVKLLVPLLRCCEHPELRESAVCALARIQPAAFRDVLEDLHPVLREAGDAKMKNIQRRRRRDTLRLALIRVLALMAQNGVFQHDEAGAISSQGHLVPALFEFLEGTRSYLESINEPSAIVVTMFRSTNAVSSSSAITAITSTPIGGAGATATGDGGGGNSGGAAPAINAAGSGGGGGESGAVSGGGPISTQNTSSVTAAATATTPSASAAASTAPAHAPTGVDPLVLLEMRLFFCVFVRDIIRHLPRERRLRFLPSGVRRNLVLLISRWTGFYEHMHHANETEWSEADWSQQMGLNYQGVAHMTPTTPTTGPGMDLVASGDLVLSISGVRLESTPQDTFISASFLDASVWLDLLWYANQAIAALVCCGSIYDPLSVFTTLTEDSSSIITAMGSTCDVSQSAVAATTSSTSLGDEEATQMVTLNSVSVPAAPPSYLVVQSASGVRQPPPGYIFHWLKGLLLCRDAKLSISPWLWGLPVVNFGVCSTALQGPHGATGVSSIRLEDNLRSIVIAAAAGRRLDSLLRQLGEETLVLLLDMNRDTPGLMELLIDQCYTGPQSAIAAFIVAITQHFIRHFSPTTRCDKFALLTLTMVFCEHPLPTVQEHATFLLQTLYYRFFLLRSREMHQKMHSTITSTPISTAAGDDDHSELCLSALTDELLWREIGCWQPCDVLRQFCAQHPACTLPMISEICRRLATASEQVRCRLIRLLHYWTINIELVDLFTRSEAHNSCSFGFHEETNQPTVTTTLAPSSESEAEAAVVETQDSDSCSSVSSSISSEEEASSISSSSTSNVDLSDCDAVPKKPSPPQNPPSRRIKQTQQDSRRRNRQVLKPETTEKTKTNELWASVPLTLRRSGWGCLKATEMVLNNFFYLTIRFADGSDESAVLEELWVLLIRYRPQNLRFILRYLIVVASLAPATLCPHVNRVVGYLANEEPSGVVDVLMAELQTIDGAGLMIEPSPLPPFFQITLLSELNAAETQQPEMYVQRRATRGENTSASQTIEQSTATTTTSAISRLTNRFTSSASAIGKRALRSALHPTSSSTHKTSGNLEQELDVDSLDCEGDDDEGETMPTALVSARSQTLPYTAASRERYNASTSAVAPINRTSRFRKILSRRRATTGAGDKESRASATGGRRNPFRSIFRSGGSGGGGATGSTLHTAAAVVTSTDLVEVASTSARLFTTSLPPNLATLQPLPLPLHSHSISHLNDYRKKGRRGGRRLSATHKRRGHRRHRVRGRKNSLSCLEYSQTAPYVRGSFVPLPMPKKGSVYHAPMRDWFTEPFVSSGPLVYSGMWSPTGARSPLVLVLVGEILKSPNRYRVAWRNHMPLLLLCLFLGLDHCRPLVQEASKQLLVNMLRVICPRIDLLRLLALQLESEAHWLPGAMASFSDKAPQFCLTLEGGPSVLADALKPRFNLPVPTDTALRDVCSCGNWVAAVSAPPSALPLSRPSLLPQTRSNHFFGSNYSLMSTSTLIPPRKTEEATVVEAVNDCPAGHFHQAAEKIAQLLLEVQDRSVWTWEDITPSRFQQATVHLIRSSFPASGTLRRQSSTSSSHLLLRSARFLDGFVRCVASALAEAETNGRCEEAATCLRCHHGEPHSHGENLDCTVTRFAQAAFNMGITCPNRHYAARSLQIYRALEAQLNEKCLSEILIRLVELLSEPNEEVQSYLVELFLTLETAVEHVRLRGSIRARKAPPDSPKPPPAIPTTPPVHERRHSRRGSSSSLSSILIHQSEPGPGTVVPPIKRPLMPPHAEEAESSETPPKTSTSGLIGAGTCRLANEEQADLLAGVFWIGVCLLDSDYEYEYLAGARLLTRLLPVCVSQEQVLKLLNRLKWTTGDELSCDFPGLIGLLLKGCFCPSLIDTASRLLVNLIPLVKSPIIDPWSGESRHYRRAPVGSRLTSSSSSTYPGNLPTLLLALLPFLLTAWDEEEGQEEGESNESWVNRAVVSFENTPPVPSSGLLSLLTTSVVSGAAAKRAPQLRPRNPVCIAAAEQLADLAVQLDPHRYSNLALVLRMYASGTFSKDVNQWARCVSRYLMDGCGQAPAPRILAFLTAYLTLGPPCVQLALLHFGYWFLQAVELNQSEMSTRIQAFIHATSERFVNTPLWPEVTLLYQVIVSRSATLTAAPTNTVLNPSTVAPVDLLILPSLDSLAATAVPLPESEPPRISLAGRVLDFDTSVLQSAPLIGGGKNQSQKSEPVTTPPLFFPIGAWKSPWSRQVRVRGLFSNLLNCYGSQLEHLTAPRSPSVIFSQSTETLDRQLSMHSSSETTSINEASNPDEANVDDTSSAERAAVFHDLDTYLDAQLMNINFLDLPDGNWDDQSRYTWGVRGHSIPSHSEFQEDVDAESQQKPELNKPTIEEATGDPVSFEVDDEDEEEEEEEDDEDDVDEEEEVVQNPPPMNGTLLAPSASRRAFNSQLLVSWNSREDDVALVPPLDARKRSQSIQQPIIHARRRPMKLSGSLDHLNSTNPPVKPPRRRVRQIGRSLDSNSRSHAPPTLPLRASKSIGSLNTTTAATSRDDKIVARTPAETAWMLTQRQLKSLTNQERTSAELDRLQLVLTGVRGVVVGMLNRSTRTAVDLAKEAFSRCPPSSDLDPEIRIANLVKIAGVIRANVPSLVFSIHPNNVRLIDTETVAQCLELASVYEDWEEAIIRLSTICASTSSSADWQRHERICRGLQTVLKRLLVFFQRCVKLFTNLKWNLVNSEGLVDVTGARIQPIFSRLRKHLSTLPRGGNLEGVDVWKRRCGGYLLKNNSSPDDEDVAKALALYAESMKLTEPLSMDDVMTIVEACCEQLWNETGVSGLVLLFAYAEGDGEGVRRLEALESTSTKERVPFFSTDEVELMQISAEVSPLDLVDRIMRLLEK